MADSQEKDFFVHQYRECYESWRQHERFIWQIPTIAVAIAGGIGVAAFGYVPETEWLGKELLLLFEAILMGCLLYAVIKHRYFSMIEQGTLCEIEKLNESKLILRTIKIPKQQKESDYWHTEKPKWFQKGSAHYVLMGGMALIFVALLALSALVFINAFWCK